MKYYILSELINKGIDIDFIVNEIIIMTIEEKRVYPGYVEWFVNKHVPQIYTGFRDTIIVVDNNQLVGVANVKTGTEKKLCTLYFKEGYRYRRVGKMLVDRAISLMGCDKPLLTVPSTSIASFKNLIKRYKWELTDCIDDCYTNGIREYVFNGEIDSANKGLSHEDRLILTYKHTKDKNILKLMSFGYIKYCLFYINNGLKRLEKVIN